MYRSVWPHLCEPHGAHWAHSTVWRTCCTRNVHCTPGTQCVPTSLSQRSLHVSRPDRLHGLLALSSEIPKTQTSVLEVGTCQHPQIPQALPPVQGAAAIQITGRPLRNMRNGSWSVSMDLLIFLSVLLSVSLSLPSCLPVYTADTRCISFLMRVCSVAGWMDGWMDGWMLTLGFSIQRSLNLTVMRILKQQACHPHSATKPQHVTGDASTKTQKRAEPVVFE